MSFCSFRKSSALLAVVGPLALVSTGLLTGCGNMMTTAPSLTPLSSGGTISGSIHGGNQPVTGASVKIYAAGSSGYGSASTLYATTTSANDAYGSFSFVKSPTNSGIVSSGTTNAYGCPSTGDPQMYVVAKGGSTQGTGNGANSAAGFIAAIGKCSTVSNSTFIDLNEVVSVGTLAALQQYFNPATESLGYPSSTQGTLGFANAVSTIANLVTIANGTANGATTLTATPTGATTAVSVTVLPEQAKINTIANITAACVNTTSNASTQCGTLFTNAYPPVAANTSQPSVTMATATDVLQATYYMLTNPASMSTVGTNNATAMTNLFGLAPATAPFQPTLSAAPTDWTIGVRYSSASACTYGTFLGAPYDLAVDATGNVWIASGGTSTTTSNLISLTPNGTPGTCALGASVALAKGLTIDTGGNVWIAGNAANSSFYKYSISGSTSTTFAVPTAAVPYAVAADGSGNIFYTDATNKTVNEFVGGAAAATAVAATNISTTVGNAPFFIAVDTSGNLFVPQSATTNLLYDLYPSTGTGNVNGYLTANIGSATNVVNPYAVAAGLGGNIYAANSTTAASSVSQTAYSFLPAASGTATFATNTAQYAGGIGAPRGPNAVDGAGNVWYANSLATTGNYAAGTTSTTYYNVSEVTSALVPLSPNGQTGGFQKDATIFASAPRALAVDLSGNVWGGSNSASGNGIFEVVGAAVPVVTPISQALKTAITAGNNNAVSKP